MTALVRCSTLRPARVATPIRSPAAPARSPRCASGISMPAAPSSILRLRSNDGANTTSGRSLINDRATCAQAQEHVPPTENIRTLRAVLTPLGAGFVEAIDDSTLTAIAQGPTGAVERSHCRRSNSSARSGGFGTNTSWPVRLERPAQQSLSFVADAYLNEMAVTSRLRPTDSTTVCKTTTDPEDQPDPLGLAHIDHFTQFLRGTQAPPRDTVLATTAGAQAGQGMFESIGCNVCHVESITAAPSGTVIDGGMYTVPDALGNKIFTTSVTSCCTMDDRRWHLSGWSRGYDEQAAGRAALGPGHQIPLYPRSDVADAGGRRPAARRGGKRGGQQLPRLERPAKAADHLISSVAVISGSWGGHRVHPPCVNSVISCARVAPLPMRNRRQTEMIVCGLTLSLRPARLARISSSKNVDSLFSPNVCRRGSNRFLSPPSVF
jgi:hypothetical protein